MLNIGNGGFLISTGLLKIISNEMLKMRRSRGSRHFRISKALFVDMKAGSAVGTSRAARWRVEPSSDEVAEI
jgi:hypothetical protein